jgi:hypothetical protein
MVLPKLIVHDSFARSMKPAAETLNLKAVIHLPLHCK